MPTLSESETISTHSEAAELPCGTVEGTFYRLIPSRFPPLDLFERIAQGREREWAELETETNPRLRAQERLTGTRVQDPVPPRFQNWNHAPFAYGARYGTRFWGPGTPALELMADIRTALLVSIRKREEFMRLTGEVPTQMDMRVLAHPVAGRFADARHLSPEAEEAERREVGRRVIGMDVDGVRFRPAEHPEGEGIAVLSTDPLGRSIQAAHFRYLWDGSNVRQIYSFDLGELFDPARLLDAKFRPCR